MHGTLQQVEPGAEGRGVDGRVARGVASVWGWDIVAAAVRLRFLLKKSLRVKELGFAQKERRGVSPTISSCALRTVIMRASAPIGVGAITPITFRFGVCCVPRKYGSGSGPSLELL